jgi:flagellar hook-length control protein FliK
VTYPAQVGGETVPATPTHVERQSAAAPSIVATPQAEQAIPSGASSPKMASREDMPSRVVEAPPRVSVEAHADASRVERLAAARSSSAIAQPLRPASGDDRSVQISTFATASSTIQVVATENRASTLAAAPLPAAPRVELPAAARSSSFIAQPSRPAASADDHRSVPVSAFAIASPSGHTEEAGEIHASTLAAPLPATPRVEPPAAARSSSGIAQPSWPAASADNHRSVQVATFATASPIGHTEEERENHASTVAASTTAAAPRAASRPPSEPGFPVSSTVARVDRDIHSAPVSSPVTSSGAEVVRRDSASVGATQRPAADPAPAITAVALRSDETHAIVDPVTTKTTPLRPGDSSSDVVRTQSDDRIERRIATSAPHMADHATPIEAHATMPSLAPPAPSRREVVENAPFVVPTASQREDRSAAQAATAQAIAAATPEASAVSVTPAVAKRVDKVAAPIATASHSDAARGSVDLAPTAERTVVDSASARPTDAPPTQATSPVVPAHEATHVTPRHAAIDAAAPSVIASATSRPEPSSPARAPLDASDSALLSSIDAFAAARAEQTNRSDRKAIGQKSAPTTSESTNARAELDDGAPSPLERGEAPVVRPLADAKQAGAAPTHPDSHHSSLSALIRAAATPAAVQAATAASDVERVTTDEETTAPTIGRIDLSTPSANPAPAMAELLAPQARALIATSRAAGVGPSGAPATQPAADTAQRAASLAAKTLTIELEPESLGAVVVKMKLAHSGVDMKISVRSEEALHKLESTRNALVEAMQSAGCSIDGCTIQIASAPTPNAQGAATDGGGFFASSNGAETERGDRNVGGEGANDGQGSGGRRRETGARDDGGPDVASRRPADRRGGGGVYL